MKQTIINLKKALQKLSLITSVEELRNTPKAYTIFAEFLQELNNGTIRSAEPLRNGSWQVNTWVKESIVRVGFRLGKVKEFSKSDDVLQFSDKDTIPVQKREDLEKRNIRIVPGGSSIRSGSYIGDNVIIMPPAYINCGAYVDANTMIDSLALVGSCAQIGKNVHIAAGAIVGGVLEPANARPCIVEDNVFMGAFSGIFSGVVLGEGVVLAPKTVITEGTEVWEAVAGKPQRMLPNSSEHPIMIPDRALVIPGTRQLTDEKGNPSPLAKNIAIIRGYYKKGGNPKLALNDVLRGE